MSSSHEKKLVYLLNCTSRFKRVVCISCRPRLDVHKGEGVRRMWTHVERGVKNLIFCKWMAPYILRFPPFLFNFPHSLQVPLFLRCSYVLTLNFLPPTKMLHFLPPKLTKPFISPLNDKIISSIKWEWWRLLLHSHHGMDAYELI